MRRMIDFECGGHKLAGTLDEADGQSGLLIVSGGNEIRSGAYAGQAAMAAYFAALGFPVFRYDRRGIGDSEGENAGFEGSADDISAAAAAFRAAAPNLSHITALGNCDAASALALFHTGQPVDALILCNPWVIEHAPHDPTEDAPTPPSAAAIRARYWARLKNPRSLLDLFTGKIDLKKLVSGLAKAAKKEAPTGLAGRIADALGAAEIPVLLLIAKHDTTAMAFMAAWADDIFVEARTHASIRLETTDTSSHSFADEAAMTWLRARILGMVAKEGLEPPTYGL
jgi:exosortase A-associated hydrolase 1